DPGQVNPGTRAALENQALLAIPVENGFHGVIDRKDEAGGNLPWRGSPDIEPDRGIKTKYLMNKSVGELVLENLSVALAREIAVLAARLAVRADHPVDELLEAPLTLRGADGATEIFRGDDVRGVHRPEIRELDSALLEVHRAVAPVSHDDV